MIHCNIFENFHISKVAFDGGPSFNFLNLKCIHALDLRFPCDNQKASQPLITLDFFDAVIIRVNNTKVFTGQ